MVLAGSSRSVASENILIEVVVFMSIVAFDGVVIKVCGNTIVCSDGLNYVLSGNILLGPMGQVSMNCRDIVEAMNIVVGIHGGRMF